MPKILFLRLESVVARRRLYNSRSCDGSTSLISTSKTQRRHKECKGVSHWTIVGTSDPTCRSSQSLSRPRLFLNNISSSKDNQRIGRCIATRTVHRRNIRGRTSDTLLVRRPSEAVGLDRYYRYRPLARFHRRLAIDLVGCHRGF